MYSPELRSRFERWRTAWISRRHPPEATVELTQQRIYILPTRALWGLLGLLLVLLLLAINYENNLAYALTFLLVGVMLVAMLHTHSNLRALVLRRAPVLAVFAGEPVRVQLDLDGGALMHRNLLLSLAGGEARAISLQAGEHLRLELAGKGARRGWCNPGLIRVDTRYPLGLFNAWSWVDLDARVLVYPRPIAGGDLNCVALAGQDGTGHPGGHEEFAGLKRYQTGMALRQIAWKPYARGLALQAKEFFEPQGHTELLDWQLWPELDGEARLSRLCYWALQLHQQGIAFGLRLPGVEVAIDLGDRHLDQVLRALALFPGEQA